MARNKTQKEYEYVELVIGNHLRKRFIYTDIERFNEMEMASYIANTFFNKSVNEYINGLCVGIDGMDKLKNNLSKDSFLKIFRKEVEPMLKHSEELSYNDMDADDLYEKLERTIKGIYKEVCYREW